MSFDTAAAISGVTPGASADRVSVVAWSDRSQLRNSPTVMEPMGAKAPDVVPVEDETGHLVAFIGDEGVLKKIGKRCVCQRHTRGGHFFSGGGSQSSKNVA
jgi:hypothetical protein